jgi:hypothetical protein
MMVMNLNELGLYSHYVVVRTKRANALVKRDPREMPKHLRLLLLAVDGHQDLGTYAANLKGFGDILELVGELIQMDMVRLMDPALARQQRMLGKSADYMSMDSALDSVSSNDSLNSSFSDGLGDGLAESSRSGPSSLQTDDLFYGSTKPGSLEALVDIAHERYPDYQPRIEPGRPVEAAAQFEQVESMFTLLEAVRGERSELKQHLLSYKDLKKTSRNIREENKQIKRQIMRLKVTCAVLLLSLLICVGLHFL